MMLSDGILGTKKAPKGGISNSNAPTTQRPGAVGRGRGGEIPSPGTGGFGDLGLERALHALRHKASAHYEKRCTVGKFRCSGIFALQMSPELQNPSPGGSKGAPGGGGGV